MTARHIALVTGSARRVGRMIASDLIDAGWSMIVHARDAGAADVAARELGALGHVSGDLSTDVGRAAVAEGAVSLCGGRLDLLVNNASSFVRATPGELTARDLDDALSVNAVAPVLLLQQLLPALQATCGLAVNISDHAAHEHWPAYAAHAASKAALESLTLSFARTLARVGVRVNAVAPGLIMRPDEPVRAAAPNHPVNDVHDVAAAILELAAAPTRTGEIIVLHSSSRG